MENLTKKQERFCQEYVIDLNGTQAAIRAGYSKKTSGQIAEQNLKKLEIQAKIAELQKAKSERLEFNADNVFNELKKYATYNIKDVIQVKQLKMNDSAGNEITRDYIHLQDWKEIDGTLISEIKQSKDLMIQVKFPDKLKALELIGRHLGMWNDKMEHSGDKDNPIQIQNTDKLDKIISNMSNDQRKMFFEIVEKNNGVD